MHARNMRGSLVGMAHGHKCHAPHDMGSNPIRSNALSDWLGVENSRHPTFESSLPSLFRLANQPRVTRWREKRQVLQIGPCGRRPHAPGPYDDLDSVKVQQKRSSPPRPAAS